MMTRVPIEEAAQVKEAAAGLALEDIPPDPIDTQRY
jgi:hypothetical protein